uniref:Uncharacterized protein n=1 Tax=Pineapple bacilliform CO virus TaxID=2033633 RepID=G8Z332_9VIRU|nr:hypothetical protein [Pineapple bacilliform CO virus]
MSLQIKRHTPAYKEALQKTASIWDSGVGQTERGIVASGTLTRQLNSLLFLLLKLHDKVSRLEEKVKRVAAPQKADISWALEYLQDIEEGGSQLDKLQTIKGATRKKRLQERGKLKVYEDPYIILKGEISTSK